MIFFRKMPNIFDTCKKIISCYNAVGKRQGVPKSILQIFSEKLSLTSVTSIQIQELNTMQ